MTGHAELSLDVVGAGRTGEVHAPPSGQRVPVQRVDRYRQYRSETVTGTQDRARYELTVPVLAAAEHMGFELILAGPGQVRMRHVELTRTA